MWYYCGDNNVEYGGTWFNLVNWRYGYVSAVRVEDLDSGCGFRGAVLIERLTVCVGAGWSKSKDRALDVLKSCGWKTIPGTGVGRKLALAEAYLGYGFYDPDSHTLSETLQLEPDGQLVFDGWKATRFDGDLKTYIEENYLD